MVNNIRKYSIQKLMLNEIIIRVGRLLAVPTIAVDKPIELDDGCSALLGAFLACEITDKPHLVKDLLEHVFAGRYVAVTTNLC